MIPLVVGVGAGLAIRHPWALAAAVIASLLVVWRKRRGSRGGEEEVMTAGQVMLVALTAGLPLPAALEVAAGTGGPTVRAEIERVLRQSQRVGMVAALAGAGGAHTRPLLSRLALAQASGAPMADAVTAFLSAGRAARRSAALERVRRLPVLLMVPLGLLILPGFIVLFVGPVLLTSLSDMFGGLL
jgi:hypothetical protein